MVSHEISRTRRGHQHRDGNPGILRMALDACGSIGRQHRALQTRRLLGRVAGICAALIIATTPLHALQCSPYGLPEALKEVDQSTDKYIAVTGKLSFDEKELPFPDADFNTPEQTKVSARINGKVLSRAGFKDRFNQPLTMSIDCLGEWCYQPRDKSRVLVFLKQTAQGYTLRLNPCVSHLFLEPSKAYLRDTQRCFLSEQCPAPTEY